MSRKDEEYVPWVNLNDQEQKLLQNDPNVTKRTSKDNEYTSYKYGDKLRTNKLNRSQSQKLSRKNFAKTAAIRVN